jgi:hypothetical protein
MKGGIDPLRRASREKEFQVKEMILFSAHMCDIRPEIW